MKLGSGKDEVGNGGQLVADQFTVKMNQKVG